MKKFFIVSLLIFTSVMANAQLKGSGKTITKTYDYKNFDKLAFEDLVGKIIIEIGKTWSISVNIYDNLENLLSFSENNLENQLKIQFDGKENNNMYIEDTNFIIKITMPEASAITNSGNSDIIIKNVLGRYFRFENTGNGDCKISGRIDVLDIIKTGNGDVNAENLIAIKADLKSVGNGNLITNVSEELTAKLSGNGDIINKGKAKFDFKSKKSGNGKLIIY